MLRITNWQDFFRESQDRSFDMCKKTNEKFSSGGIENLHSI